MRLILIAILSMVFMSCAHSEYDYQDPDRYPATVDHSSMPVRAVDKDYWAICLKERTEAYCRRRLGY